MFLRFIKNLFRAELINSLVTEKEIFFKPKKQKKIFYVIKKKFNSNGLFSNLVFVLDHLKYAQKKNYVPLIDMENFPTVYNEKTIINNSLNSWFYYFEKINNYKLSKIYQKHFFLFSSNNRFTKKEINEDKNLQKVFINKIKIKKDILRDYKKIKKRIFKKKDNILGVHVRGTIQRIVSNHSLPPDPKDFLKETIKIFNKKKCNKIFLVTEDNLYLDIFKNYFKNNLIYLNTPRSNPKFYQFHNFHFSNYVRKMHRYKLGREAIIDALLLSNVKTFIFTDSNVWRFATVMNINKQDKYEFKTSLNSKNRFVARWKWYLKFYSPFIFGPLNYKMIKHKHD